MNSGVTECVVSVNSGVTECVVSVNSVVTECVVSVNSGVPDRRNVYSIWDSTILVNKKKLGPFQTEQCQVQMEESS